MRHPGLGSRQKQPSHALRSLAPRPWDAEPPSDLDLPPARAIDPSQSTSITVDQRSVETTVVDLGPAAMLLSMLVKAPRVSTLKPSIRTLEPRAPRTWLPPPSPQGRPSYSALVQTRHSGQGPPRQGHRAIPSYVNCRRPGARGFRSRHPGRATPRLEPPAGTSSPWRGETSGPGHPRAATSVRLLWPISSRSV